MRDLVYIVADRSVTNYFPLKISLRSAEKNLKFWRVFIYGYQPPFLNNRVYNVYIPDDRGQTKYQNAAKKTRALLADNRLSKEIIYMHEDFYVLKPHEKIPYYYNGTLKEWVEKWPYKLKNNLYYQKLCALYEIFPDGKFFEVHCPIIYDREKAKKLLDEYKSGEIPMFRSYYCNYYIKELSLVRETRDYKMKNISDIKKIIELDAAFATSTDFIEQTPIFRKTMLALFPDRSKYEV